MAWEHPPYQFLDGEGEPWGLDVEVARLVFAKLGREVVFVAGDWDDVLASLRLGQVDCVTGVEIYRNHGRGRFSFTSPYYKRKAVIFVHQGDPDIFEAADLVSKVVAGDRSSYVEQYLRSRGLLKSIRIVKTKSIDQSMQMLVEGRVVAVIAPMAVGLLLAERHGVAVRIMDMGDPGSPVGFAVEKGNEELRNRLEAVLEALKREGALKPVLERWVR
ncbi:transporter substrate-binding domain-containing protein [Pseudodesulfovibrio thermohalotolerans]|uniref:transporter substrate-binding domain-containing protein n=1 Tax=Pseudodesulfovibrio thermohalotolerans TaxID=2880651 RepID=UPI0022B9DED3|nr:transporter substrate-binding domain-containing protein [Pseudodesulfovibrio thermohalotolerans]WFS61362.1 transporter substrate-binding domain-containing protein [Pseudodesulfovibrio thermohalotolerans]